MQVWSVNCIYSFKFNSNSLACIAIWTHNEEMECDNCEIAVPGFIARHYTVHTVMKMCWWSVCGNHHAVSSGFGAPDSTVVFIDALCTQKI